MIKNKIYRVQSVREQKYIFFYSFAEDVSSEGVETGAETDQ